MCVTIFGYTIARLTGEDITYRSWSVAWRRNETDDNKLTITV